jgi:Protein of unknown function, DUF547
MPRSQFSRLTARVAVATLVIGRPLTAASVETLDPWSSVLTRFVDEQGRTDFDAVAADRSALDEFVAFVARVSPATAPERFPRRADVLAYHLNAYNALAMKGVIDEQITDGFSGFFKRQRFFRFRKVTVGGRSMSLSTYENDVIRPLCEPRMHFAARVCLRYRDEAVDPGFAVRFIPYDWTLNHQP